MQRTPKERNDPKSELEKSDERSDAVHENIITEKREKCRYRTHEWRPPTRSVINSLTAIFDREGHTVWQALGRLKREQRYKNLTSEIETL